MTDPLTFCKAKLAEMRELCDTATPGPWWLKDEDFGLRGEYDPPSVGNDDVTVATVRVGIKEQTANGAMIAASRTAWPALLTAWEQEIQIGSNPETVRRLAEALGWRGHE